MTTTRQQRSPLGAMVRTPLGAFGRAAAQPVDGLIILGFMGPVVGVALDPYTWGVTDETEPGSPDVRCRFSERFDTGGPGFRTLINMQQYDPGDLPAPVGAEPEHVDIYDYTFIGDNTGERWKASDHVLYVCTASGGTVAEHSSGGGNAPAPGAGTIGDFPPTGSGSPGPFTVQLFFASSDVSQHPLLLPNEPFTAYPPSRVPP